MDAGHGQVLLVEDDHDAAVFMLRALEKADPNCAVQILGDGEQAIDYLSEKISQPGTTLPHLIITDLKMPRKSGFEVISWIRSRPSLSKVPVIVMSGSNAQPDIDLAMKLGADAYFEKPLALSELVEMARAFVEGRFDYEPKKK